MQGSDCKVLFVADASPEASNPEPSEDGLLALPLSLSAGSVVLATVWRGLEVTSKLPIHASSSVSSLITISVGSTSPKHSKELHDK